MKKESYIEHTVCRELQKLGCRTPKISDNPGWPDRLIVAPGGKHIFIEFKRPGGKLSNIQIAVTSMLAGLGHLVFVVDRTDEQVINELWRNLK